MNKKQAKLREDTRDAFEVWAISERMVTSKYNDGEYSNPDTEAAFHGYCAAVSAQLDKKPEASPSAKAAQAELAECHTALAAVRDLFPTPAPGSPLESFWADAMSVPTLVPDYVKARLAATLIASPVSGQVDCRTTTQPTQTRTRKENEALSALNQKWQWSGDWMTCTQCKRSLIASRDGEDLSHAAGCKQAADQHPWRAMREILSGMGPDSTELFPLLAEKDAVRRWPK